MPPPVPVLLASVPPLEAALARRLLPHAAISPLSPGPELARAHPDAQILAVAAQDHVDAATLSAWPRLGGLVTRSGGTDHLPLAWLRERGIVACHLDGYATTSVVEHALALILALARRLPEAMALTQGEAPS